MAFLVLDEEDTNSVIRMVAQFFLPLAFYDFVNIYRCKRFVAAGKVSFVVQNFGHLFECFAFLYAPWLPARHFDFLDDATDSQPIRN